MIKINPSELYLSDTIVRSKGEKLKTSPSFITVDSRSVIKDSLFVALKGENFDGHDFLDKAASSGATCLVVNESEINANNVDKLAERYKELNFIFVRDTKAYLYHLTSIISTSFYNKGGRTFCISGSNGKTTTKEMLSFILNVLKFPTIKTEKNNNNDIGVPLTLFQIQEETQFAIVELGSNHPGEIKMLCDMIDPHIGYCTNIGDTHLEFFDNQKNVFLEESYLYQAIKNSQKKPKVFFQNSFDQFLETLQGECLSPISQNLFNLKTDHNSAEFIFESNPYRIENKNLIGDYNFLNLAVSCLFASYLTKTPMKTLVEKAKDFIPGMKRSQWVKFKDSMVFLDAYNANPSSMSKSIDAFLATIPDSSRGESMIVIGDMNELGVMSAYFHQELGKKIKGINCKTIVYVGQYFQDFLKGFQEKEKLTDKKALLLSFPNVQEAKLKRIDFGIGTSPYIMIKASRSLQLEQIIDIT